MGCKSAVFILSLCLLLGLALSAPPDVQPLRRLARQAGLRRPSASINASAGDGAPAATASSSAGANAASSAEASAVAASANKRRPQDPDEGQAPGRLAASGSVGVTASGEQEPAPGAKRRPAKRPAVRPPSRQHDYEPEDDEAEDDEACDDYPGHDVFARPIGHMRRLVGDMFDHMQGMASMDYGSLPGGSMAVASSYSGQNGDSRMSSLVRSNGKTRGIIRESRQGRVKVKRIGDDENEDDDYERRPDSDSEE